MSAPSFVWDPKKAAGNLRKHGVGFPEATEVFRDRLARLRHDPDHSSDEDRWILLGVSLRDRVLVVVFTEEPGKIRVISARRATRRERNAYEEEQ